MKKLLCLLLWINLCFVTGCAIILPPRALPPQVPITEVVQMSKSGVNAQTIIAKIDSSLTVYHLSSKDVIQLKENGVPHEVIDFMLATEKRDIAAREHRRWHIYHDNPYF